MSEAFNEHDEKAQEIKTWAEKALNWMKETYSINYKEPPHDIARRLLNEIVEFQAEEEKY